MDGRSYRILLFFGGIFFALFLVMTSAGAKKNPFEKREKAITHLARLDGRKNTPGFNRYLKKVIRIYSKQLKELRDLISDTESMLLLAEAERYLISIQTGVLSPNSTINKLKQDHDLMTLIEARIPQKSVKPQDATAFQTVTVSADGGLTTSGQVDHAPAKKIKQDHDLFDISISVPVSLGKRHGIDRLYEEE